MGRLTALSLAALATALASAGCGSATTPVPTTSGIETKTVCASTLRDYQALANGFATANPTDAEERKTVTAATAVKNDLRSLGEASATNSAAAGGAITAAAELTNQLQHATVSAWIGGVAADGLMGTIADTVGTLCK
jgi:hypothetical protein